MKKLVLALLIACSGVHISTQQLAVPYSSLYGTNSCIINQDIIYKYRASLYDFGVKMYKTLAIRSNLNFVSSVTSTWIMLAAIAEGADPLTQQNLFQLLSLPNEPCIRQAYYRLATTRAIPSFDVNVKSTRVLLIDDATTLNPTWYDFVVKNSLFEVVRAPIRYNPVATADTIERIMSARFPRLDFSGNSVLLDTMDYNGLWSTAFADAVIERTPFYNLEGEEIGAVDIMRVQRRARVGYLKQLNAKFLELPVGSDGRYRMLFCMILGNDLRPLLGEINSNIVFELFASLRTSSVPIDVSIPRLVIQSEVDMRVILEDVGINDLWTDPAVTR